MSLLTGLTALIILYYTKETWLLRKESQKQTELSIAPIMSLHVRYINGVKNEQERKSIREKYSITHQVETGIVPSEYYLALRNMGQGPALNVEVESDNFKVLRYQTQIFAAEPNADEHAIKIVKKPDNKIRSLGEVNGEEFVIKCKSISGKSYKYKYRISDLTTRSVEFVEVL